MGCSSFKVSLKRSIFSSLIFFFCLSLSADDLYRYTAALPATDAVGRRLPTHDEVGDVRPDRFVGLFYWTWHTNFAKGMDAFDVTKFLAEHPAAIDDYDDPAWGGRKETHFWGEPLFGYYRDTDEWVLRKHAEMLGEAGVDVIIFDCTNGNMTWEESYMKLCEVFAQARCEGVKTPQIAFILAFGPTEGSRQAITELYQKLYKPGLYKDLWFMWKGKPLIMAYDDHLTDNAPGSLDVEIRDFFTFRPGQPDYKRGAYHPNQWGWLEIYPQHGYLPDENGQYEEVPVGVAQNWSDERGLTAMNAPGSFGRSYTHRNGQAEDPSAVNLGLNFEEQWERALQLDPEFIFITGWNEWIAGRFPEWQQQQNAFPDEFSQEKSRDIEPMRGGHGDNYYWQMVANIRRFKGMPAPDYVYRTHQGNTFHRNHPGWGNAWLTNEKGRNDLVAADVKESAKRLVFSAACAAPVTAPEDDRWMNLYIDVDCDHATGWEGYDYAVSVQQPFVSRTASLKRYMNGQWQTIGTVRMKLRRNEVRYIVSKERMGLSPKAPFDVEFKWTDNIQGNDILSFWTDGDVAPLGRFNYPYHSRYKKSAEGHDY